MPKHTLSNWWIVIFCLMSFLSITIATIMYIGLLIFFSVVIHCYILSFLSWNPLTSLSPKKNSSESLLSKFSIVTMTSIFKSSRLPILPKDLLSRDDMLPQADRMEMHQISPSAIVGVSCIRFYRQGMRLCNHQWYHCRRDQDRCHQEVWWPSNYCNRKMHAVQYIQLREGWGGLQWIYIPRMLCL